MPHHTLRGIALLTSLVGALALTACGEEDSSNVSDIPSTATPSSAVATIDGIPIEKKDLDAQVDTLARAQQGDSKEKSEAERKQLETQALSLLLIREALEQEAADRDIRVSQAEARRRWNSATYSETRKKVRRGLLAGRTEQDLLDQVYLQLLTERINQQVNDDVGGGDKGMAEVAKFQRQFQKKWRSKVECAKGYAAPGCDKESK